MYEFKVHLSLKKSNEIKSKSFLDMEEAIKHLEEASVKLDENNEHIYSRYSIIISSEGTDLSVSGPFKDEKIDTDELRNKLLNGIQRLDNTIKQFER